ncbi:MAG: hypothetical protein CMH53_02520 [Myxococcales bacterium]|nr:hypothetical protein [Myxococcales bacterium]
MNKGASTPVESRACLGLPEDKPSSPASKGLNVLNTSLSLCSEQPVTGWFRDGHCRTSAQDRGQHTVCAEMTERFLRFTASKGNDLSSPSLRHGFAGLRPGDRWCLCAARWAEAYRAGVAPKPILQATEQSSLQVIALDVLVKQAQADSVD